MNPQTRLERWEKRSEWPLAGIAVVFLAAYSIQVLAQPQGYTAAVLQAVLLITYLAFVVDYVVRLSLAPNRARWFVRHLFDLAIVALPMLRPLQLLRLVVVVTTLQRAVGDAIRGRVILYTVSCATVLVYAASLAILEVERSHPDANIKNFGDAVWWSISTVTTVGYGDRLPYTGWGRVIAVLLMIGGITLVGAVTATLASWIVQRVAEVDSANRAATAAQIEELREEIQRLTKSLAATDGADGAASGLARSGSEPAYGEGRDG